MRMLVTERTSCYMTEKQTKTRSLPVVTVITVTWNLVRSERVDYVRECIESVHAQDYPEIEHLIVDGASDDGTLDILAEYEQKGWIKCYSEPDAGIYDAMNKGIAKATGKYIAFLNSDDFWHHPKAVSLSVELLEKTNADFSYAPRKLINLDGSLRAYQGAHMAAFYRQMPFGHQTMFTKTSVIREHGGFADDRLKISADYDLVTRLLLSGAKTVYVPLCFTSFRAGGASGSIDDVRREFSAIHEYNYGSYVGAAAAKQLITGCFPIALLQMLRTVFHYSVFSEIEKFVVIKNGKAQIAHRVRNCNTEQKALNVHSVYFNRADAVAIPVATSYRLPRASVISYRFLGIPLLTKKTNASLVKIKFAGIPIFFVKKHKEKDNQLLNTVSFLGIPILRKKQTPKAVKWTLFCFLPVFSQIKK